MTSRSHFHNFTRPRVLGMGLHIWALLIILLLVAGTCCQAVSDLTEGKFSDGLLMAEVSFGLSVLFIPLLPFIGWQARVARSRQGLALGQAKQAIWPLLLTGLLWVSASGLVDYV